MVFLGYFIGISDIHSNAEDDTRATKGVFDFTSGTLDLSILTK